MGLEIGLLGAIGAGVSAAGSIAGGFAAADASRYQAQVADNNARLAEMNAQRAVRSGYMEAERTGMKGREQLGQIASIQGASGLEVGAGTGGQVQESARIVNRYDQEQDVYKGAVAGVNFRNQANNFRAEAQLKRMSANNSQISGFMGAANSLLGSARAFGPKWADMATSTPAFNNDTINMLTVY